MKKILFVFVILLTVSCSGNGVPLDEAELEDFCSRQNAGKEIFIGHKGEAAGSIFRTVHHIADECTDGAPYVFFLRKHHNRKA